MLLDSDLRVVVANRAASLLFRVPAPRLRGVPVTTIVPDSNLDLLLREFGERRTKVVEMHLPAKGRNRTPVTLKITAVRLANFGAIATERRASNHSRAKREFRLLLLEDISDRATLEQQLVESEKQAAMGQLAAGILHEVTNPLTSMGSNLLFVRGRLANPGYDDVRQALEASLDQVDQMRQLLGTLSGLPRRPAPRYEMADAHDVVRQCVTFVARDAERRHIELAMSFAPSPMLCQMDIRLMKQVLLNLLKNAMEAMPNGGRLEVRTMPRAADGDEPASVVIEVEDTGVGITEADLRKVFRPLFSTKPRGAGLGLSFCRQAVEEHGGAVRLISRGKGQGTVAIVSLPVQQAVTVYD